MEQFILILSPFESIHENLVLEQFYMMQKGDFIILYKNRKSVVIGRNQVCYSEIALKEQVKQQISLVRRYSGGGTVFLDEGTLNYAFITDFSFEKCTYSYFNNIIIRTLSEIGYQNIVEKGCNINYQDCKISGTAQYKRNNRFIHHGTLLVDSNLILLESVCSQSDNYITRAKRSEPVKTINLIKINPVYTMEKFEKCFSTVFMNYYCSCLLEVNQNVFDYVSIRKADFKDKSWTFGNSPYYKFSNKIIFPDGLNFEVFFEVKMGRVTYQFFSEKSPFSEVNFVGYFHSFDDFYPIVARTVGGNENSIEVNNICYQFFNGEKRA